MTLLAHWKMGDGRAGGPSVAKDAAAGGSGAHDGTYNLTSTYVFPGGPYGGHLYSTYQGGYIYNILNPADLRILGELTISAWVHHWDEYLGWQTGVHYVCVCHKSAWSTEADNNPWYFCVYNQALYLSWQYGSVPTGVAVQSTVELKGKWSHVAVKRYEISPGYYGVKFYIDGQLVETMDNGGPGWPGPTGGGNALPFMGRNEANLQAYYVHYHSTSIRIYDEALLDEDIEDIYDTELALFQSEIEQEGVYNGLDGAGLTDGIF